MNRLNRIADEVMARGLTQLHQRAGPYLHNLESLHLALTCNQRLARQLNAAKGRQAHQALHAAPGLTASQAALRLRCCANTVRRMAQEGRLPASVQKGWWRFDEQELSRWIRENHLGTERRIGSSCPGR